MRNEILKKIYKESVMADDINSNAKEYLVLVDLIQKMRNSKLLISKRLGLLSRHSQSILLGIRLFCKISLVSIGVLPAS